MNSGDNLPESFRPLIGVSFCKLEWSKHPAEDFDWVFVPLSGSVSVNEIHALAIQAWICLSFRPLIGVSFCKHYARTTLCCSKVFVFVPLSGSVSVNYQYLQNHLRCYQCFRPLIGVSFCKRPLWS